MNKVQAMLFILSAEDKAMKRNDIVRATEIRADYILLCDGFYDWLFDETNDINAFVRSIGQNR
ncbi:MAG: hypothetical protein LBH43_01400 [Treponema sp.]|nr:hypothetical protein [Treponema sp.]